MKLTLEGLKDQAAWQAAGIALPSYDVAQVAQRTKQAPVWVHFGAGNIFRIFIGGLAAYTIVWDLGDVRRWPDDDLQSDRSVSDGRRSAGFSEGL